MRKVSDHVKAYRQKWIKDKRKRENKIGELRKKRNIIGQVFGRLTVIAQAESKNWATYWLCQCICGNFKTAIRHALTQGNVQSCGCLKSEVTTKRNTTHNCTRTKEYIAWSNMKARCYNLLDHRYEYYGLIGIKVCDRWLDSFENFINDMGFCPSPELSIDRIKTNGNYEPDNCRWATSEVQMNNTTRNVFVTFKDETLTLSQWTKKLKIDKNIWYREKYRNVPKQQIIEMFYKKVS